MPSGALSEHGAASGSGSGDAAMTVKTDTDRDGEWESTTRGSVSPSTGDGPTDFTPPDMIAPTTSVLGVDHDWHSQPVPVSFAATDDPSGAGVAYTEYKLDDGSWKQGTSLIVPAPPKTKVAHTILYRSADNAGNVEAAKSCTVKIDTTGGPPSPLSPVTTASGYDDAWHRGPVTITLMAVPAVGGLSVAYTEYRLGGGEWTRGTSVTVPASADHSGDGVRIVTYRSADIGVPPSIEDEKACTVKIDTTGPTTLARANARVKRGKTVVLKYRVNDALPNGLGLSPTATVRIVFETARHKVVKRLSLGERATNVPLSTKWRCTLKRGSYRLRIYATDEAGNVQAKVGGGKLIVRK